MVPHRPKRRKFSHDGLEARMSSDSDVEENVAVRPDPHAFPGLTVRRKSKICFGGSSVSDSKVQPFGDISMFKLQVDELLLEVRPDYSKLNGLVDSTLHRVKDVIDSMADQAPRSVAEATELMQATHGISIPFPDPRPSLDVVYKLAYGHPSDINVVGSYVFESMIKGSHIITIDMVVTMPQSILQEKDYLNHRYFHKRAYYVACLAAELRNELGNDHDICFDFLGGNSLQPVVKIKPRKSVDDGDSSTPDFQIQVMPTAPEEFFSEVKLRPNMNAVRLRAASKDGKTSPPTPFYNGTMRAESTVKRYLKLIHRSRKYSHSFRDACVLGRIWLRQRGFSGALAGGGFGHFEWTVLAALLLQGLGPNGQAVLSSSYSSHQLFRAVIEYLSTADFMANPVRFRTPVVLDHVGHPTLYDGPRGHNILFKMTPWSCAALRDEAKISLKTLHDPAFDPFEATFILKADHPLQKYDCLLHLPLTKSAESYEKPDACVQNSAASLYEILKEGLTDRVSDIQIILPESVPWSLMSKTPCTTSRVLVGMIYNPVNVDRVVDHGPAAENKEAAARFRNLWGKKAELRRFKDGSILESVLWTTSAESSVIKRTVRYLLEHKLGAEFCRKVTFVENDFPRLFLPDSDNGAECFSKLNEAFIVLQRDMSDLRALPLNPKLILAISSQLRLSSVQLPLFNSHRRLQHPAEVVVQFESSGRWPDSMVAVQRTKLVFLSKIGRLLETHVEGLTARLMLENAGRPLLNRAILDVIYPTGAIFRLRIYVDNEQTLLERQLKDKTLDPRAREEVILARSINTSMYIHLPLHTQSIAAYCARNPFLSQTIRLVKKWFASHMLSGHIREELIELMVMRIFLQPYPWRAPSSPSTGLLRTLDFLSRWDWRTTPLIVDFSGSMTTNDVTGIYSRLEAWRKIDPGMNRMVIVAASNHDMTGTTFTDQGLSKVVAVRMTALARSACSLIKAKELDMGLKILFTSSTTDYDFVVHISPRFTNHSEQEKVGKAGSFKNLEVQVREDLSHTGYDPIQLYLAELKTLYSESIVLFHDSLTNKLIGGLWNPMTKSRSFKINLPYSTKPFAGNSIEDTKKSVHIDKQAILTEIARLGNDMITGIEVHE